MSVKINVSKGQSVDRALKALKRTLAKEGVIRELRKHRCYEKPSVTKRRKAKDRARILRKAQRERMKAMLG